MMRQTALILLTLAAAVPAAAQPPRVDTRTVVKVKVRTDVEGRVALYQQGRDEQTDRSTRTVKIGADGELVLGNIAGDITVTRGGGSDATIEIVKTARGRTPDEAKQMLPMVEVEVIERSGRAEVKTRYPNQDEMRRGGNRRNINVSVAYIVTAPGNARLTATSISGSIKVTDIKGDLSLSSISGDVRIANGGRVASAKTISGNVEILDTQIDGALDASSTSGNVLVRKVRARRVALGTISGNIVAQDVQSERIEAQSISGDVELAGALTRGGRYQLNSHSGQVRIAVPGDIGFELDANTFSGSVRCDLPLTVRDRDRDDRMVRRRSIHGVYGDGSAVLDVTTFSGSVVISKR